MKIVGEKLNQSEMKNVKGGSTYSCYCGFVGGGGEDSKFLIEAGGIGGALDSAGASCGGAGATCQESDEQIVA